MPFWSPIIQQVLMIASLFGALFPSTFSFAQPSPTIPTHWATEAITDAQSDFRPFPITRIRLARKEVQAAFESTKKMDSSRLHRWNISGGMEKTSELE